MSDARDTEELGRELRDRARDEAEEVDAYLASNPAEWAEIAHCTPSDAADIVEQVDDTAALSLLRRLKDEDASEVLDEMRPEVVAELVEELPPDIAASVLARMSTHRAADALGVLPDEARASVLAKLPHAFAAEVAALLSYPSDSAGGMMATELVTLSPEMTVVATTEALRHQRERVEDIDAVFVVGPERQLLGLISLRELIFASPAARLDEVMEKNPICVAPEEDRERVVELALRYNLDTLPVRDAGGRLMGAVPLAAVLDALQSEATEDMAVASGTGAEEMVFTRVLRSVRMRLPWLFANVVMALAIVFAIERQKGIIDQNAVLAALMPLIAQVGGNGGAQSLAVVLRGLALDAVRSQRVPRILLRQLSIGLINGVAIGTAAGILGGFIGGPRVGAAVGLGALLNLTVGSISGGAIPIVLRKLGLDPALASNIFLTLITDLVGFAGFLVIAAILL